MINEEPLSGYPDLSDSERLARIDAFETTMRTRRTVRQFDDVPVPREIIDAAIRIAARAPSGANMQPWSFVAVSDGAVKARIRAAAEAEEREFYGGRASASWLDALRPFGTDAHKPFLETAPWLIAVFAQPHGLEHDGSKRKHYYVKESVGLATGFLLAALHVAGLATLTHTPSPMHFLRDILERPAEEQAFLLVVTGRPAEGATVPRIDKKRVAEVATFYEA
ncbi:MAG: nitroreductase family protein [Trueperaceae bacterium]|nr:nitroreductase family protein [Trueperaceae bacterium]